MFILGFIHRCSYANNIKGVTPQGESLNQLRQESHKVWYGMLELINQVVSVC